MYANMEKVIKEYDKHMTTFYDMNIQQAGEIYENSNCTFEMISKAFKFGVWTFDSWSNKNKSKLVKRKSRNRRKINEIKQNRINQLINTKRSMKAPLFYCKGEWLSSNNFNYYKDNSCF